MALRSGYKGIKKLAAGLKWNRPGVLAADDLALANVFFPRSEQAVLGARNIMPFPYKHSSDSFSGVEYTVNGDGTVSVNTPTSASADAYFLFFQATRDTLPPGTYIYATGYASDDTTSYAQAWNGSTFVKALAAMYTEKYALFTVDYNGYDNVQFSFRVKNGKSVDHITLYPQLLLPTEPNPELFTSPAMTNEQLTEKVQGIINAATNAADFAAFKTAIGNL